MSHQINAIGFRAERIDCNKLSADCELAWRRYERTVAGYGRTSTQAQAAYKRFLVADRRFLRVYG